MVAKEWMTFESTGTIEDYLTYSHSRAVNGTDQRDGSDILNSIGQESENWDGANHDTYRYGTDSNPHRGI